MRPQSFLRINSVSDLWTFVSEEAVFSSSWKFGNLSFLELCCDLSFGNFLVIWAAYWKSSDSSGLCRFFIPSILMQGCCGGISLTQHAPHFSRLCRFLVMLLHHQWITILVYLVDMGKHYQIKEMKYQCSLLLLWNRRSCYIWVCVCVLQIWQQVGFSYFWVWSSWAPNHRLPLEEMSVFTFGMVSVMSQLHRPAAGWICSAVTERRVLRRGMITGEGVSYAQNQLNWTVQISEFHCL